MKKFTIYKMIQTEIVEIFRQFITELTNEQRQGIETGEQAYNYLTEELYRKVMHIIILRKLTGK
jgi:hypothetical protein